MAAEIGRAAVVGGVVRDATTVLGERAIRFNEAAANGRGNPTSGRCSSGGPWGFNEAAANGRGNRTARAKSPSGSNRSLQ